MDGSLDGALGTCLSACHGQDLLGMAAEMIVVHFLLFSLRESAQHPPAIRAMQSRADSLVTGCTVYGTTCHITCVNAATVAPCNKVQALDLAGLRSGGPTFALRLSSAAALHSK